MTAPHETGTGVGVSYGPAYRGWRDLPCYACGSRKGGAAYAYPGLPPEGTMRLCARHDPLAFTDWDEIDRLHARYSVGT